MRIGTLLGHLGNIGQEFKNESEDITFGKHLPGKVFFPKKPKNGLGVVFLNGWGAGQECYYENADWAASLGYTSLTFDYRGFGRYKKGTTGTTLDALMDTRLPLSSRRGMEDTCDAIDALLGYVGKDGRCALDGHSYGGHLAILTEHRAVDARITRGAPDFLPPIPSRAGRFRVQIHTAILDPVANYFTVFPLPPARRIYERASAPKQINVIYTEGADHLGFCNIRKAPRQKAIVNHYSQAWVERYLDGDKSEANRRKLLERKPGVFILRTDLGE